MAARKKLPVIPEESGSTSLDIKLSKTSSTPAAGSKPGAHTKFKANLLIAAGILGLVVLGVLSYFALKPKVISGMITPTSTPKVATPTPSPATMASPLTGVQVSPQLALRPITGVIIENFDPDARPQSGLGDAGVVYEANAEGGITRFEAFFLENRPPVIGPVRSVRTYFVDWALEFNAPLAHAGGNADALDEIGPLGMKDMNALSFAQDGFYRTTDRYAPHNLYTSSDKLDALELRLGFNQPAKFTPSPRKPDQPAKNPPHPHIHIDFSYSGYEVDWNYDPATNTYARNMGGAPHIDRNTGTQIHAKNIVIEMMPTSYGFTRIGESTVIMQTVGTGQGWVCRDGDCVDVTWSKSSHSARTQLLDAAGKDTPLDAGNTWYEIVPIGKTVTF